MKDEDMTAIFCVASALFGYYIHLEFGLYQLVAPNTGLSH